MRCIRGGCFVNDPEYARSDYRNREELSFIRHYLGLRPARTLPR